MMRRWLLLFFLLVPGALFGQWYGALPVTLSDSLIGPDFFGFDPWSKDAGLWTKALTAMDQY